MASDKVMLAGGLVEVAVSGHGPPIWVFHSLLADAGSCVPLAAALAERFTVMLPHLPGFAGSAVAGPELAAVADRMAAAMAETATPAAIVANGYGSFVALTVALRHPHLVSRMVLAGTGAAFSEPGRAAFRGMAAAARAKGLEAIADTAMRRLFAPAFQAANPALLAERRERFLATDEAVFTGACDALTALDIRSAVPGLAMPVMVMVGAEDEATPPAMARELAGLVPGAVFVELEGLAHVPQMQDTRRFMGEIEAFLAA